MFVTTQPDTSRTLSEKNVDIVRATLPVIGAHINEITPIFYDKMFTAHPELINDLFNRGNQAAGEQPKALAASIATFATMLVDPDAPDPVEMLGRIGHKHVSLGVTRDQYQIVHDNLFAAIVDVLGDAITPEIAGAWDEVYWLMADVLIDFEEDLYASDDVEPGEVFREVTVTEKYDLPGDVTVYTLSGDLSVPRPGQYTSVGVKLDDGARQLRQYSIIGGDATKLTIAVRREGEVSGFLRDRVDVGDTVQATLPAGDLVLDDADNPVVLVSSGIGSTPMTGMLHHLATTGSSRPVAVLHADVDEEHFAQREQMAAYVAEIPGATMEVRYRSNGERIDIAEHLPAGATVYLCGGNGFLQALRDQIAALPADRAPKAVHFELFSPNDWLIS
ncbi:globin domain-containing protein [Corynebacterium sp. P5848]|uniref:globin domain-containing protein n=1 Tax=Corynebacterium marambiense TaxID=2765364 RepID=UPI002260F6F9|nr:globin domain-containing protein [Corynebacterium marambiense]MCX7543110.1 globin domain-containing protein [Corynebacterium marambiense]